MSPNLKYITNFINANDTLARNSQIYAHFLQSYEISGPLKMKLQVELVYSSISVVAPSTSTSASSTLYVEETASTNPLPSISTVISPSYSQVAHYIIITVNDDAVFDYNNTDINLLNF